MVNKDYLRFLVNEIHTTVMATVDENAFPVTCAIDIMDYDDENFLNDNLNKHILFLELGVGMNTPVIIKYPFWQMTYKNPNAFYACVNKGEYGCPTEIDKRSVGIDMDIGEFLERLVL